MIEERIKMAEEGRSFWMSLEDERQREVGSKDFLVVLLCTSNPALYHGALDSLEELSMQHKVCPVVVLSREDIYASALAWYTEKETGKTKMSSQVSLRAITEENIENLLAFYTLYQFTDRLFIVSMDRPFGSKLSSFPCSQDPSEILRYGMLRLKPYDSKKKG